MLVIYFSFGNYEKTVGHVTSTYGFFSCEVVSSILSHSVVLGTSYAILSNSYSNCITNVRNKVVTGRVLIYELC